ncbi:MAG: hypothetical protein HYZ83_03275 [Candidatus Omnitrophica bacterium]|nr:hypothetical protein [Candidatus Omnitrophota bacterium]
MTFHDNSSFWPKLRAVQKFFRQGIASFITVSFILNIAPVPIYAITPTEQEVLTNTPTQSLSEPEQTSSSIVVKEIVRQTTQDFLQENEIALTPVTSEKSNENVITSDNEPEITTSENDSFENAISKLTQAKDFAVAIVKQINQENLVHLAKQAYEYGIAVVKGVILLFTSHEENQLSVTAVFKSLLDTAVSFLAHFQVAHGQSPAQEQPSWMDIENALEVEHVASLQNEEVHVVTYGAQGVDPTVRNADYLLDKITAVHDPAQKSLEEIRQYVGVAEIQDKDSLIPYRSDPPTIFPGRPILSPFGSSSKFGQPDAFISVNQSSDSQFRLNFDVTNTSSTGNAFGGAVFNFAVSDTVKSQDLSGFSKFSFELRTDSACPAPDSQGCLKIEFKDTSGRVGAVRLSGITSSFQQGDIPKSLFLQSEPNLDFVHIKEIVFVVEHANVSPKQGFFEVKTGGLHFDASISPDATNPDITKVPQAGRKDDAGNTNLIRPDLTGFQSNNMDRRPPGTLAESRPEFQDWSKVDVNLTSETSAEITFNLFNVGGQKVGNDVVPTSFGGAFIAYDDPKTDDKDPLTTNDIETINLNTVFPNGIVLGLNHGGTGITEVFLEVTDITGKQDKVQLVGIDSTNRRWKVLASQFDEVDITKIKTFALTLAGRHVGQKLNVDWGNFSFVPGIVADATNPDITKVPQAERKDDAGNTNLIRPDLTGFQSNNTDRRAPGTR